METFFVFAFYDQEALRTFDGVLALLLPVQVGRDWDAGVRLVHAGAGHSRAHG